MTESASYQKAIYPCRVCGFDQMYDQWKPASFNICSCCACQFGYNDLALSQVRRYRMHWLINGANWFSENKSRKPENWQSIDVVINQLKNIPPEWW